LADSTRSRFNATLAGKRIELARLAQNEELGRASREAGRTERMGQKEMAITGKNRIMICGPKKNDGMYIVEFTTAADEALAISIPRTEAALIRHCLMGCSCPTFREVKKAPASLRLCESWGELATPTGSVGDAGAASNIELEQVPVEFTYNLRA
jgi:hypothetical protein